MKVFEKLLCEIPGTNSHFFKLSELSEEQSNVGLFLGYDFLENPNSYIESEGILKKIYLNITMPTEFCGDQSIFADDKFDEIWGICPYSVGWLNEIKSTNKYKTIFYPFNENDIPNKVEKKYDVIYHGGLHGQKYLRMLEIISRYNYRYLSQTFGINSMTMMMLGYATDTNLSNTDKLQKIAESKISICFNSFEVRDQNDLNHVKSKPNWQRNEAFKHVEDLGIIPQFKSRCNEAAFCRTLNLVQRDPWNIIERYYDTDEFVYFDHVEELPFKINEILTNWDSYGDMIEKAYQRSLNYTTKNLYKTIKLNDSK